MTLRTLSLIILSVLAFTNIEGQKSNKKIIITGTVVDAHNYPVSGARVLIDRKKTNRITDESGSYKVRAKPSAEKIAIIAPSSELKEIKIEGRTIINFSLDNLIIQQPDKSVNSYGEEEINIGYSTVKRKNLVGQVNKLDASKKRNFTYNSIYEMIKGQFPGVEVNGNSIRIQGANSFMGSTEPLFVVDGMAVNTIDFINPMDVKSIEILKGSSAAVYGSRGANGVILITLKGSFGDR